MITIPLIAPIIGAALIGLAGALVSGIGKLFAVGKGWNDYRKGLTGSGLTSAQIEQNAFTMQQQQAQQQFNAQQAQLNRDWQERMSNTAYQRGTADMVAAGLNPAMMYGGSASSASTPSGGAATSSAPSGGISAGVSAGLIDSLLNVAFAGERFKQLKLETEKMKKENEGLGLDNEQKQLVLDYYPQVQDATLDKISAEVDQIFNTMELQDLQGENYSADSDLKRSQTEWQNLRNGKASEYINAEIEKMKAGSEAERQAAAKSLSEKVYQDALNDYFKKYHSLPSSHFVLGIGSAVSELLHENNLEPSLVTLPARKIKEIILNSDAYKNALKRRNADKLGLNEIMKGSGLWPDDFDSPRFRLNYPRYRSYRSFFPSRFLEDSDF